MPTDISTSAAVTIDAPASRVWEALTTPELIKQWFFGVDTESDWTEGGSIVHRGEYKGETYEDKGTILRIIPERMLVHTHWSPMSAMPDEPENYQEVAWTLTESQGKTQLTVNEVNLPSTDAKATSDEGWKSALAGLKRVVEV
jgi:uncharacterized protein YndB with AHSA1/START domain